MGEDGALFVWGYGFCGQLEMGDTQLPVLPSFKGETQDKVSRKPACAPTPGVLAVLAHF